jgi:hypothetical protein
MIKPAGVALQSRFDLAQTVRARYLRIDQRNQLPLRAQPAHMLVGPVRVHKLLETMPRHMLQQSVQYAILMPHGVASSRVSNVGERSKHRRIHAMHPVH